MFPFEETPDQLAAIADVKTDMESDKPMDRLICGDVGYGKTEVALRAAFKAVQDGKQVMVLCPTTILAQQHYTTFSERFEPFGVRVEVLSRFRTQGPAGRVARRLRGRHGRRPHRHAPAALGRRHAQGARARHHRRGAALRRRAQGAPQEPARAGRHPHALGDAYPSDAADVALGRARHVGHRHASAQPLPGRGPRGRVRRRRRLGCDPPRDRARRPGLLRLEPRRSRSTRPSSACARPRPRRASESATGRCPSSSSSASWSRSRQASSTCSSRRRSSSPGIDNPHTNTLIIEDSQRLGLAQLYQLKGRVGRSHIKAYAYFMFPSGASLTEQAVDRLVAIKENTELGSGIKVAMRDLEIRGAGSLLGAEQHGNVSAVGFDLYAEMLRQAVAEARGETCRPSPRSASTCPLPAFLPEEYVPAVDERVLLYRRLAASAHARGGRAPGRGASSSATGRLPSRPRTCSRWRASGRLPREAGRRRRVTVVRRRLIVGSADPRRRAARSARARRRDLPREGEKARPAARVWRFCDRGSSRHARCYTRCRL